MNAFQPIGDQARWRILLELLRGVPTGDVLSYERMAERLELDPIRDRHAMQMALRRAARDHEEIDFRALEAVPNVGYRVVQPPEHLRLARQQQKRSTRALRSGHSKAVHVDLSQLDAQTRKAFETVALAFTMQMDFNRRFDVRQKRLEEAVAIIVDRSERSESEITALRERLERLEREQGEGTT